MLWSTVDCAPSPQKTIIDDAVTPLKQKIEGINTSSQGSSGFRQRFWVSGQNIILESLHNNGFCEDYVPCLDVTVDEGCTRRVFFSRCILQSP